MKPRRRKKSAGKSSGKAPVSLLAIGSDWRLSAGLIFLGGILLFVCSRGDLWFDEIWSFEWVRRAASPWDVLTKLHHDNNHPINTWWLMFLGGWCPSIVCRLPAVICGVLSLVLVDRLAAQIHPSSRAVAVALCAFSFPLVLYFSEARGYAPAVACSLAVAVILMENCLRPRWFVALLFWMVCIVGMLSHATFLLILAAFGCWKMVHIWRGGNGLGKTLLEGCLWFAVPGIAAAAYYLEFLRPMQIGGGPEYSLGRVLGHFFGYALGFPVEGGWAVGAVVVGGSAYLASIAFCLRGSAFCPAFVLLPVSAALGLLLTQPDILYFRYFLVFLPFFYMALGVLFARMASFSSTGFSLVAALLLVAFLILQVPRLVALCTFGRGGYERALMLVATSPYANKTVTSDQDFRNGLLVEFYRKHRPLLENVKYVGLAQARTGVAGWLITHTQEPLENPPRSSLEIGAGKFRLVAVFPYAGVSGWHWMIYRSEMSGAWTPPQL